MCPVPNVGGVEHTGKSEPREGCCRWTLNVRASRLRLERTWSPGGPSFNFSGPHAGEKFPLYFSIHRASWRHVHQLEFCRCWVVPQVVPAEGTRQGQQPPVLRNWYLQVARVSSHLHLQSSPKEMIGSSGLPESLTVETSYSYVLRSRSPLPVV